MSDEDRSLGQPTWMDLSTSDMAAAAAFYGAVFGWQFNDAGEEFGHYNMITSDGAAVGGAMTKMDPAMPEAWSVYLDVDDIDVAAERIKQAGGQIVVEPMAVGALGHMLFAVDPAGAAVGAWHAGDFGGFEAMARPGAPAWFEALSKNYPASVEFYQNAFGWDAHVMSDTDDFKYTTLGKDEDVKAGIMDASRFLPEGMPSMWQAYIQVADTDAVVQKALDNGGKVLRAAEDTPYGRLAQLADSTGAAFCVMQSPSS